MSITWSAVESSACSTGVVWTRLAGGAGEGSLRGGSGRGGGTGAGEGGRSVSSLQALCKRLPGAPPSCGGCPALLRRSLTSHYHNPWRNVVTTRACLPFNLVDKSTLQAPKRQVEEKK